MSRVLLISLYEVAYLGTRALLSYLLEKGHTVHNIHLKSFTGKEFEGVIEEHDAYQVIVDGTIYRFGIDINSITPKEYALLKEAIEEFKPDIVGLSARSLYKKLLPDLMPILTSLQTKPLLVAGGYGPTLEPELFINAGFDTVILGEGEESINDIAMHYDNPEILHTVKNTVWKIDNTFKYNPMREMCRNLSQYPSPLNGSKFFSLIESDTYSRNKDHTEDGDAYSIILGRGCTGKCTYCCGGQWTNIYKNQGLPALKRRNRDLDSIFKELHSIDLTIFKTIHFTDELFIASPDFMREFFIRYKNEINLPFFMYLKYDFLLRHEDIFDLAIAAGWNQTAIGVQSGSEEFAKKYYHRDYKNESYIAYAHKLFEHNVQISIHLIGGNCYETDEDFFKTVDLIQALPFSLSDFDKTVTSNIRLKPFPKTPLLDIAPKVLTDPMPAIEWFRRTIILNLARLLPKQEIHKLYYDKQYHDNPYPLKELYGKLRKEQLHTYYEEMKGILKNKHVVFYGASSCLNDTFEYFKEINPKAIILDEKYMSTDVSKYKLPLYEAEKYIQEHPEAHVMIFSSNPFVLRRKLQSLKVPQNQILECNLAWLFQPTSQKS